jgi:hypothetical protein
VARWSPRTASSASRSAERDLWQLFRKTYANEPFVRLVSARSRDPSLPEPKLLAGTNWCDVGFATDADDPRHVVVIAAIDNLMKGAAGSAVQCMNLMCGFEEDAWGSPSPDCTRHERGAGCPQGRRWAPRSITTQSLPTFSAHWQAGNRLVMVHGGASFLNDISTKLGAPPEFLTSESGHTSRRTDRRTLEIFEMVYCGSMNKGWVERFQRRGVNAVGALPVSTAGSGRGREGRRFGVVKNGRRLVVRDDYTGRGRTGEHRLARDAPEWRIPAGPHASRGQHQRRGDQRRRRPGRRAHRGRASARRRS